MFTELKIKRICKKFKAPDIDIPELAPVVHKRPRLKPVLATAALALVIVGASVVGIKGNIFKGEQPLPPVDTDTPDTPDTPTPPDTDTPTPPEDDVKIIYADSAPGIGLGLEWVGPLAGELWIADDFEKVLNSNESKDCKFAVYIAINSGLGYNTRDLLSEYDEKYRQLLEVCDEAQITRIMLTHVIDDGYDDNVKYFKEYREKFIITFEEYMKDVTEGSNDVILFTEEEIEKLNKIISLTDDELKENMTLLRELEKTFMIICSDAYIKLDEYEKEIRSSVIADYANSVTVKEFEKIGLKNVRCISEKKAKTLGIEVFNGDIFEATLTRDEIYSLKETKYGIYLYPREYGIDLSANE